jgi:hypothetical protein
MNMLLNFFRFKSCARFEFDTSSLPLHDNVMMVWGDDDATVGLNQAAAQ